MSSTYISSADWNAFTDALVAKAYTCTTAWWRGNHFSAFAILAILIGTGTQLLAIFRKSAPATQLTSFKEFLDMSSQHFVSVELDG